MMIPQHRIHFCVSASRHNSLLHTAWIYSKIEIMSLTSVIMYSGEMVELSWIISITD